MVGFGYRVFFMVVVAVGMLWLANMAPAAAAAGVQTLASHAFHALTSVVK
jgi:hypothetical protein